MLRDAVAASVRLVSVLPGELPAGIEHLQAEMKDAKRTVKDLQGRLATFEVCLSPIGQRRSGQSAP